ncbi:hypothetical protein [Algoriphagus sediminis]|uniref:Uncharacterized protein n=1 Tax=Algoriphagus sediminis TaxID=3057113 RepID=A0ABT7Y8B6_9BACT|nr:hypothetical protein [Algoriphagus sediminis]MDN3202763.1 hypothetical protein [Algoriphagus sediminis]
MEKYLSIINKRTFIALGIAAVAVFLTVNFNFEYNFDLTMISIAIIFPLVFTIRSAFKRREKALEFLSRFRSGLITTDASIQSNSKLNGQERIMIRGHILEISRLMTLYLGPETLGFESVRKEASRVTAFVNERKEKFKAGPTLKIYGLFRDVYQGIENAGAIKEHRTPTSIRAYCLIFIYLYPVIYSPSLYYRLSSGIGDWDIWVLYFLCLFSTFILISLFNVQEQLENPFDQDGLDDIHLDSFRVNEDDLVEIKNE